MAYIVPKELPKTCFECVFRQCKFSHPFWAERVPESERNKQGHFCSLDTQKPKRLMIVDFGDKTKIMEWCPLKEIEDVVRCKDCKHCKMCYPEKQIGQEPTPGWYCKVHKSYRREDDFCSYGERREGE